MNWKDVIQRIKERKVQDKNSQKFYADRLKWFYKTNKIMGPFLKELTNKEGIKTYISSWNTSWEITLGKEEYDKAWEITERVMELLKLEDGAVKKMFYAYGNNPQWYWHITPFKGCEVDVYWAEPDTDCIPKQHAHTSLSWTCEK